MSSKLVDALKRFNRKERFWLLSDALGKSLLSLDPDFLARVAKELGIKVPIDPWWAFDYHLDWLYAVLSFGPSYDLTDLRQPRSNELKHVKGNQEDCDLLIAFDDTIILVEAKMGTSWSNKQMASKGRRLASLPIDHVQAYLLLTSPSKTSKLTCSEWPTWATKQGAQKSPYHIALTNGHIDSTALMVSRCDVSGKKDSKGGYWNAFTA